MIAPHGGTLINRLVAENEREALLAKAAGLPSITLNSREVSDLEMITVGAMSPLSGFMTEADYNGVLDNMHLADGNAWPLPVVLATKGTDAAPEAGTEIALVGECGTVYGTMAVSSVWAMDKERELDVCFSGTNEKADHGHPAWGYIETLGSHYIGGVISVATLPSYEKHNDYRFTPVQTRAAFEEKGWETIAVFQTRNPIHRAHEYLTKVALEQTDGLLVHPLVGDTKADDIPSDVRMECYHALLNKYYPLDRTMLGVYPQAMRYGGPREAILHAVCRQNYGITHIIIGRDHAGVGSYYGTFDAQQIFDSFKPGELKIETLRFEHSFFCKLTGGMATTKSSPAGPEDKIFLSGTKVREMLQNGERPPAEFTRPEVADILVRCMQVS
ncbi:MAG: sulfate adenylyltransferase [Planctomycetes bacterium]|jgi:sulfate adenylyltransferase|nr:sulfate adenylyltransferase [Planctomycetota bacterium]MBT4029274.1 sulfate adenylyltransferase [Planctomycetota bacterium]MBT4560453.1 sulfate adenylyltransferase [Planctomycetota bacterium]MBT5101471.1 sulfate adenylyltransferase [Planctomycetota bacterium]MBT5120026.1 sulfate adenylyltransferase [Planctomycetota bacterium]